ncbi:flavin-containing monooxygenase 5-like isoform X2 [Physella acuta]|nr:flavin-containing monooxygenase 5-like isoform X2 [Physella acuta]
MSSKRVAIIGAGASGLTAIKTCLDEGLTPVCFERTEHIGGLWRYTDETVDGQACVMKSTVINTSKEMMSYSDFPIPEKYPVFMHNTQVYEYFKLYAQKFDLEKYINFSTEILLVTRADNFSATGKWEVKYSSTKTKEEKSEIFDGVLVCSGHHADKYVPTFPGLSKFKGQVVHTHDYRKPDGYDDKRVLIIGFGNSGGDVAVELSRKASQVFLSTRRGTWILNRVADQGYPVDMLFSRRPLMKLVEMFPGLISKYQERKINQKIDHSLYSLRPEHGIFQQHPFVNDDMPNRIICGSIKIKADVKCFTETGVEFVDGTSEDNIDVVLLATGYTFGFPFIDKEVIEVKDNRVQLYKQMYPPELEKKSLAIIGCFQPLGAIMPISEMQCRLATRVIKGETVLPSKAVMWQDIRQKEAAMAKRYYKTQRHTIQVDYISFMDELAELVGCNIDFWAIFKRDPVLALTVMFGPVTPYTYRLCGPGQWSGAREAIRTQWQRIKHPLQTRPVPSKRCDLARNSFLFNFGVVVILFFILRFLLSLL